MDRGPWPGHEPPTVRVRLEAEVAVGSRPAADRVRGLALLEAEARHGGLDEEVVDPLPWKSGRGVPEAETLPALSCPSLSTDVTW